MFPCFISCSFVLDAYNPKFLYGFRKNLWPWQPRIILLNSDEVKILQPLTDSNELLFPCMELGFMRRQFRFTFSITFPRLHLRELGLFFCHNI